MQIDKQYWPFEVVNDHGKLKIKMEYRENTKSRNLFDASYDKRIYVI